MDVDVDVEVEVEVEVEDEMSSLQDVHLSYSASTWTVVKLSVHAASIFDFIDPQRYK
ncbi:hypothetical protein Sjap_011200 [Stephania japonica]|uniref:Uncharacterized protein n=1 Tax=Stephania japonica TaxID=461633 RepID=A0AAP0JD35_9MAGN